MVTSYDVDEAGDFEVRLLGPIQALHRGRALDVGGLQARSVLAVLLLHPNQVVPRGVIVHDAWRGQPPETARDLVTHYVSRLRRALAPVGARLRLEAVRPGFRALINRELIDAHRFTALLRQAEQDRTAGEDGLAAAHLERALALWRGHTLAMEDLEADWLRQQAVVLQDRRLDALEQLASLHQAAGGHGRVVHLLRGEAPRRPDRDDLVAALVTSLAATGQGAEAVSVADRAIDALDQVGLPVGPHLRAARRHAQRPAAALVPAPPRQLPPDINAPVGRGRELAELMHLADTASGDGAATALVVTAIDGMAGIGKTALAIHAGHKLAEKFPGGQLFLDLHGFTQGLSPRPATDVLADLLRTLGVPTQQLPDDLDARAALYRDRLAGRRVLVVLDNAKSEEQVRPLLPGDPGCLVLVTSRTRLKGLDEARVLSLDLLSASDAAALLRAVAGPGRVPAGDPRLDEIAHLCGRLPLALRIAAALLRHRPSWSLAHLAERLRDARPALAGFHDGDRDLTAVFDLSYAALPAHQQALFRRLGLHPGADIDAYAAAALLDTSPQAADALLQHLVDHNLLAESPAGRYRMHDLIRAHARTLTGADPEPDREAALTRLLEFYQHTAAHASRPLARIPTLRNVGPAPVNGPDLSDPSTAQRWLRTERANLEAAFEHTCRHSRPSAVALAAGLAEIMLIDGPWVRAVAVHKAAVAVAERLGDKLAQATAANALSHAQWLSADYPGATDTTTRALHLSRDVRDSHEHAKALANLGRIRCMTGDYPGALDALAEALHLFQNLGNHLGQANVLIEMGRARSITGDHAGATDALNQALHLSRRHRFPHVEAGALLDLGIVRGLSADHAAAVDVLTQALGLSRALGLRFSEATALAALGRAQLQAGDHPGALDSITQALSVFREHGDRGNEACALNVHAAVLAATGDQPQALTLYRQALVLNREVDHPDDEAIALEGIGECLLSAGHVDQGTDHLDQALTIFRKLGMHPDTDRVQTRLADISADQRREGIEVGTLVSVEEA